MKAQKTKDHIFEITYCTILTDHILSTPQGHRTEIVKASNWKDLKSYIEISADLYSNPYKYDPKHSFGFWFLSSSGGVKIKPYKVPSIKEI